MKPTKYYTINGVEVFLTDCMPNNVESFEKGANVNAYTLDKFDLLCKSCEENGLDVDDCLRSTYYEAYNGSYAENGDAICYATVVNCENEQHTIEDWVLVDELKDINEELVEHGFTPNN